MKKEDFDIGKCNSENNGLHELVSLLKAGAHKRPSQLEQFDGASEFDVLRAAGGTFTESSQIWKAQQSLIRNAANCRISKADSHKLRDTGVNICGRVDTLLQLQAR
ncbi:MAG: hypothetical protein R3B45_14660 [Bdellovibrionota bacterium]